MTLHIQQVGKHFGEQSLFDNVTFQVSTDSRLALVGRNGCGKSTLLKMLMGLEDPSAGSFRRSPGLLVNYLSQEPHLNLDNTLLEECQTVFAHVDGLQQEETEILEQLGTADAAEQERLLERLSDVQAALERYNPEQIEGTIHRTLQGLGFESDQYTQLTRSFSGGWRMRINLAKVLLEGADILLLDEPTNHLDLEACEWLEAFLSNYQGGIVVVSHDRHFLDRMTTQTAELEQGRLTLYPGNYSAYQQLKAEQQAAQLSAYERQQKEITKQQAFVDKFRASARRSTQAKSRERQLDKMERIEAPTDDKRKITLRFPPPEPSGREVLTIQDLRKQFTETPLFNGVNAVLERDQRVFLLGGNGAGKTTFLRLLLGLDTPDTGSVNQGHNLKLGYFSQQQLETLDGESTPMATVHDAYPDMTHTEVRTLLGQFLFSGDSVFKKVEVLSGGEKSRLALAKLMLSGANTLLLDEPTNHMDLPAKERMMEAFRQFQGTQLIISHDRHLIQGLATHIWELYAGQLICYEGDYTFYLRHKEARRAQVDARHEKAKRQAAASAAAKEKQEAKASSVSQKESFAKKPPKGVSEKDLKRLEKAIVQTEEELASVHQQLVDPVLQTDYEALSQLSKQAEELQEQLSELNTQWESMASLFA